MAKSSGANDPVTKRRSIHVVKPHTDPDFLYDMALPAQHGLLTTELGTSLKLAEPFSEKKA